MSWHKPILPPVTCCRLRRIRNRTGKHKPHRLLLFCSLETYIVSQPRKTCSLTNKQRLDIVPESCCCYCSFQFLLAGVVSRNSNFGVLRFIFIFIMYTCVSLHVSEYRFLRSPEGGIGCSGAGVTGGSEPLHMGAGNRAWVCWKSTKSHLSIPFVWYSLGYA